LIIYNTERLTEKNIGVQVFALLLSTTFVQKVFLSDKHLAVFRSRMSQEGMQVLWLLLFTDLNEDYNGSIKLNKISQYKIP